MSKSTVLAATLVGALVVCVTAALLLFRPICRTPSGYCPLPGDTAHWPPDDCWVPDSPPTARCAMHFFWRACDLDTARGGQEGCDKARALWDSGVAP